MSDYRGWDPDGRDALQEAIASEFGDSISIEDIVEPPQGQNNDTHDVIETASGEKIGVKICSAGPNHGVENEALAYIFADRIGVSNAGDAEIIDPRSEFRDPFDSSEFLAVRWLSKSDDPEDDQLQNNREEARNHNRLFLAQYGEWAIFTTAMGLTDRSADNLIWDSEEKELAHIDFERAFTRNPWTEKGDVFWENLKLARSYGNLEGATWASDADYGPGLALQRGLENGHDLLASQTSVIQSSLEGWGFGSDMVGSVLRWVEWPVGEKVEFARTLFGN